MSTPRDFEDRIAGGIARWIQSIRYDAGSGKLICELITNPEFTPDAIRVLEFGAVLAYRSAWFEEEEDFIEGLIGAHEQLDGSQFLYLLVTDQRELEIQAQEPVRIYDVSQSS